MNPVAARLLAATLVLSGPGALAGAEARPDPGPRRLGDGELNLNIRVRHESVEPAGRRDAEALTVRTRLGYSVFTGDGLGAMVEMENVFSPYPDRYSQAGLNPGGAARAVVADPEVTELNQAWVAYERGATKARIGRQRLVFDHARFVGDVGWRQNMQTFDAVSLERKTAGGVALSYAYVARVNRVLGNRQPQGNWESDSHVAQATYAGRRAGTLTGYVHLLDLGDAAAQSCATYGLSFAGAKPIGGRVRLTWRAELAGQEDYGASPLDYAAVYQSYEIGLAGARGAVALGHERLGSDAGGSFRTPLATLHAFNGWADVFLATPGGGLRDTYLKASADLPLQVGFLGFYHRFEPDGAGAKYGTELDLQVTRKFGEAVTGLVKFARFDGVGAAFPDVEKFWLGLEFAY